MDLFAAKLRSIIRGAISESKSYKARSGYVTVVGNMGLEPDWTITIGCEISISKEEFDFLVEILREAGAGFCPPEDRNDHLPLFDKIKDLKDGYTDKDGEHFPGVFDANRDGINLRDHMRLYSMVSGERGPGIFDRITKDGFDQLVQDWRQRYYSTEGEWAPGEPRHVEFDPICRWCSYRMGKAPGGYPIDAAEMLSDAEITRKLKSGDGGYCCGDPVRPKYFGFQKSGALRGSPEWLQYQWAEVISVVTKQYKRDVFEAVVDKLGLENNQFPELHNFVFGDYDQQGYPKNADYITPKQRYNKSSLGAPPHMQHRELQLPKNVYLGDKGYRTYYVQVKLHLDPKNSKDQSFRTKELDNEKANPFGYQEKGKYEKDLKALQLAAAQDNDDFIGDYHSGFLEHFLRSIAGKKFQETSHTYTSPNGVTYAVSKIATGIRGLNFFTDSFMPVKQAELDRRPEYHGKKQLQFYEPEGSEPLGLHQADAYGAIGGHDAPILDELKQQLEEGLSELGPLSLTLAPWHPKKPFPIDVHGNVYVILDDNVITLTDKSELTGSKISNNKDLSITINVNKNSCAICIKKKKKLEEEFEEAKLEGSFSVAKLEREIIKLSRKINSVHTEIVQNKDYTDEGKTDFASEKFAKSYSRLSKLGRDMNTYALWSKPWLILNLKRLEKAGTVRHPFKHTGWVKVTGAGGFFDLLSNRLDEKTKGADGRDIAEAVGLLRSKLLEYFQEYDKELLHPDSKKVEYGDNNDTVNISGLDWMDKIAIPINFSSTAFVMMDKENPTPASVVAYDRWCATRNVINTNVYMQIVPHSIIKRHLGIPQDEALEEIVEAGDGSIVPYVLTPYVTERREEGQETSKELDELADMIELDEPEEEGEPSHVAGGPGGTPYAPEKQEEYHTLGDGETEGEIDDDNDDDDDDEEESHEDYEDEDQAGADPYDETSFFLGDNDDDDDDIDPDDFYQ